jgi:D-alanyl-D-alanine carboxypeptidase/D-alanyl-D-alanine-endopeptidase (penicillin-binding protein 4)
MPTGKQRIPAAVPLFATLIAAVGASLWPGCSATSTSVSASSEVAAAQIEPVAAVNGLHASLTREIKGIIRSGIDQAVRKGAERGKCRVSVLVKQLGVEGSLVEVDADRPMKPASNLKLATTAVALALLGADAHFETTIQSAVAPAGDVLSGDLIVRAGGDPLYVEELNGAVAPLLAPLVKTLKEEGVGRVSGDLVLDLGVFGEAQPAPGWPSASQHWKDYCALSSGFTANAGCITLRVTPGDSLGPAKVEITPRGHGAQVDVAVRTLKRGEALDLKAVISPKLIKVWGDIPADVKEWTGRYAHPDPVGLFGNVLLLALEEGGVTVDGGARLERAAPGGITLATLRTPIMDSLVPINTHSNNAVADQLFLKTGADGVGSGDRFGGSAAALKALTQLGLEAEAYKQVDGSGLSRNNRISARQIVTLLDAVVGRGDVGADAFMNSLALAGESGTLTDRMKGTVAESMVRAKTGFIAGTSALSGVAMTDDERFFCFSVLVEYPAVAGLNRQIWKPMQDRICEAIVRGP